MTRFWAKVDRQGDGCWIWLAGKSGGYGRFRIGGRTVYAHRFAYETEVGSIPDQLVIDHLCRNRACVNPAHLEPVTDAENLRRGPGNGFALRTHCKHGHPFEVGRRVCLACGRAKQRRYRARRAA